MSMVFGGRSLDEWVRLLDTGIVSIGELRLLGIPEDWSGLSPCTPGTDLDGWFNLATKDLIVWWGENVDQGEAASALLTLEET